MRKYAIRFSLILFIFSVLFVSCKTNKAASNEEAEVVFNINTTPCYGQCPVYDLSLYGNKELIFEGKQHTFIEGVHQKELSDKQFEALLGIIEATDWDKMQPNYTSNMTDLPTQNFVYNRNGISKRVSKYGTEPRELSTMSELILTFIEEQVFVEK